MADTIENRKKAIEEEFEKTVMSSQEQKIQEDKRIKIIPETLEAVIMPDFKMKIIDTAHTKQITDKIVEIGDAYENHVFATEKQRYEAKLKRNINIFNITLLNDKGEAFTKEDYEKYADKPTVGLGAMDKLVEKLYIFLVVQGGAVGLGY